MGHHALANAIIFLFANIKKSTLPRRVACHLDRRTGLCITPYKESKEDLHQTRQFVLLNHRQRQKRLWQE